MLNAFEAASLLIAVFLVVYNQRIRTACVQLRLLARSMKKEFGRPPETIREAAPGRQTEKAS